MSVLDVLLPPACAGCGRPGRLLCGDCHGRLREPSPADHCFLAVDAGVVVGDSLDLAVGAFAYEGPLRRALAALKYTGVARLAPLLAVAASPRLDTLLAVSGSAALVPVPVHPERLRERGYNQATLLGRDLARRARLPLLECLARARPTTKQHRLDRVGRLRNLRGAFTAVAKPPVTAILVDDIITTTATLEACASVLRGAGSASVYGFAIAREV